MAQELQPDASVERLMGVLEKAEASSETGARFTDVGWVQLHEIVQVFITDLYRESIQESQRSRAQVVTDADVRHANDNIYKKVRNKKKWLNMVSSTAGFIAGAAATRSFSSLFQGSINPLTLALLFLTTLIGVAVMVWGLVRD